MSERPRHTSWASFFPGKPGEWYLGFVEITTPDKPQPRASKQFVYGMSLPRGYDTSKHFKYTSAQLPQLEFYANSGLAH